MLERDRRVLAALAYTNRAWRSTTEIAEDSFLNRHATYRALIALESRGRVERRRVPRKFQWRLAPGQSLDK